MSPDIDLIVESAQWNALADLDALTRDCVRAALAESGARLAAPCEMSVTFCDDAAIRRLNAQWRNQDKPTNVLSFPTPGPLAAKTLLGDIVVAYETVAREAQEQSKRLRDHVAHMVAHGFLHLIGYDHETLAEAEAMEALERRIARTLGFPDPYGEEKPPGSELNGPHVDTI